MNGETLINTITMTTSIHTSSIVSPSQTRTFHSLLQTIICTKRIAWEVVTKIYHEDLTIPVILIVQMKTENPTTHSMKEIIDNLMTHIVPNILIAPLVPEDHYIDLLKMKRLAATKMSLVKSTHQRGLLTLLMKMTASIMVKTESMTKTIFIHIAKAATNTTIHSMLVTSSMTTLTTTRINSRVAITTVISIRNNITTENILTGVIFVINTLATNMAINTKRDVMTTMINSRGSHSMIFVMKVSHIQMMTNIKMCHTTIVTTGMIDLVETMSR
mmetsp:Transcript_5206/g.10428  ORF Transcript_5206/g.10428 Transcript_5206/m.10428 type:complete len:273 (+) Transcript_5206:2296-3114(+)